jgi:dynamin 1-like protein
MDFTSSFENRRSVIDEHGNLPEIILAEVPQKLRSHPNQESARILMETKIIQNLIYSYYNIVKKNVADLVPKTIMALLVKESSRMAQSELVVKVYQAEDIE